MESGWKLSWLYNWWKTTFTSQVKWQPAQPHSDLGGLFFNLWWTWMQPVGGAAKHFNSVKQKGPNLHEQRDSSSPKNFKKTSNLHRNLKSCHSGAPWCSFLSVFSSPQMGSQYAQQQNVGGYGQPGQPPYFSPPQQQPAAPSQPPYMQPRPLPQQVRPNSQTSLFSCFLNS